MRYLLAVCLTAALAFPSRADSPPPWLPFTSISANGAYVAEVFAEPGSEQLPVYERKYRIRISEKSGGNVLWEVTYKFDGYEGGTPSDDGRYFAYVSSWYSEDTPIVSVYQKQGTSNFTGRDLLMESGSLKSTASHKLWLEAGSHFVGDQKAEKCLVVSTVQGLRTIALGPNPSFQRTAFGCR